jgi:hypothetical protein
MISEPRRATGLLALALLATSGCGESGPPRPADPDEARTALCAALDAWKVGRPPDALAGSRPPVFVRDHDWQAGLYLHDYEVTAGEPRGGAYRCSVRLTLRGQNGKPYSKTGFYGVGTSPARTVIREDE